MPIFIVYLDDPDPRFRAEMSMHLRGFGAAARPAVPKLLRLAGSVTEPDTRQEAVQTLRVVDPEGALKIFVENLEAPDAKVRASAAENLRWLGNGGGPAVPALVKHLKDPDRNARLGAALALGDIGQQPDLAIPALLESVGGQDLWLRTFSALALGKFGDRAKRAVPAIQALLEEHKTNQFYERELR